jgi:hypothetical protein
MTGDFMSASFERQVKHRQQWLEKIIDFSSDLLGKCGQTLSYQVHSCHVTSTQELKGFHAFSFWSHGAYTMFGGEKLKVWFKDALVLEVEWWEIQTLHVLVFDPSPVWRRKLTSLMGNRGIISAWASAERKKLNKNTAAEKKQTEREHKRERLEADAVRLRL